jgi:hypothetical protein
MLALRRASVSRISGQWQDDDIDSGIGDALAEDPVSGFIIPLGFESSLILAQAELLDHAPPCQSGEREPGYADPGEPPSRNWRHPTGLRFCRPLGSSWGLGIDSPKKLDRPGDRGEKFSTTTEQKL